jgi:hypothetical protein
MALMGYALQAFTFAAVWEKQLGLDDTTSAEDIFASSTQSQAPHFTYYYSYS